MRLAKIPAVAVVVGGKDDIFRSAYEAVEENISLLVFDGTGLAANVIAAAYDRREQPLVYHKLALIALI